MKKIVLLSFTVVLAACGNHADDSKDNTDAATIAAVTQTPVAGQVAEAVMTNDIDVTQLQGEWVSTEDPKSKLIITKDKYILAYEGEKADSSTYTLSKKDCSGNADANSEGYFIALPADDMCYAIDNLDSENLSLIYTARGNMLNYKRVK